MSKKSILFELSADLMETKTAKQIGQIARGQNKPEGLPGKSFTSIFLLRNHDIELSMVLHVLDKDGETEKVETFSSS
eukprot:763418-Hanusia_phi.AAC.7